MPQQRSLNPQIQQIQQIQQRQPNPQIQQIQQRPPNPQIQQISQPQFLQITNTQLNEPKCVTFNENVEQKNITPDNKQTNNAQSTQQNIQQNIQQNTELDNSNLVAEIKKN
jgi:hypothetical protein